MSQREPIHEGGALITCLHQGESGFGAKETEPITKFLAKEETPKHLVLFCRICWIIIICISVFYFP